MAKAKIDRLDKAVTPLGVFMWPKLFEPDTKFKAEGEYVLDVRFSGEDAEAFEALVVKTYADYVASIEAKGDNVHKQKNDLPLKPHVDRDTGEETGDKVAKFKSRFKPGVFDSKQQPVTEEVWSGTVGRVSFTFKGYNNGAIGSGLSLELRGVQIKELHTKGGGGASDFEEIEDGYVAPVVPAGDFAEADDATDGDY